jgi:hypothetical protein
VTVPAAIYGSGTRVMGKTVEIRMQRAEANFFEE